LNIKLAAVLSLLVTAPSAASAVEFNNATHLLNNPLIQAVRSTGTYIVFDGPACRDGFYGRYAYLAETDVSILEICDAKHTDTEELADTVRHESWHLVQRCKGGPVFSAHSLKAEASPGLINQVANNYKPEDHHHELEAFIVAADMSNTYIAQQLTKYCL
jgi:hypothetical protein